MKKSLSTEEKVLRDKRRKVMSKFQLFRSVFSSTLQDYFCSSRYVSLESVPPWREESKSELSIEQRTQLESRLLENFNMTPLDLSHKVSIYRGHIRLLEVDAIVNPTDKSMNSGFGGEFQNLDKNIIVV